MEAVLNQKRAKECEEFLKQVSKGKIKAFTSDFNLDSVVITMGIKKAKSRDIAKFLMNVMAFEGLTIYSLDIVDRIIATKFMEKNNLDFDDAIVCFAARSLGLKKLVSFDSDFDNVPGIKRVEPISII